MKQPRKKSPANKKSHSHLQKIWGFYDVADKKWLNTSLMGINSKDIESIISTFGKQKLIDKFNLSKDVVVKQRLINHRAELLYQR